MIVPSKYDEIRPYEPEELHDIFTRLANNPDFGNVISFLYPGFPKEAIVGKMLQCQTNLDFQKGFSYPFLEKLLAECSDGMTVDSSAIDVSGRYSFVSNHRDIILDSALLSKALLDAGFTTTTEIAIGDNLLAKPWIEDLVRINKAFIVRRSLGPREFLLSSKLMSEYMHFAINTKNENIWIAQREGRAKDSDDRTQPSILKMMAMGGEGSLKESLIDLHICPLTISYEYDPCDYLKAKEFQLKRDTEYKKTKQDDLVNMKTGIFGYKGRVHYHFAPCIDKWIESLPDDMSKSDFFDAVAAHIDKEIHSNYSLYPCNYIALDMLEGTDVHVSNYSDDEKVAFSVYLDKQLAKIEIENKDVDFLRERMLTMYANPLRNYLRATASV